MKRLFYALMMAVAFLAQSCEKSEPGERGVIYDLGSEEALKMRRSNAMFFDGVKVVDIDKVIIVFRSPKQPKTTRNNQT